MRAWLDPTMKPRLEDGEETERDRFRCFIAVLLDPAVLEELQVVQHMVRRHLETGVRWTLPEQVHMTLHFLGDVEATDIGVLAKALEGVASGFTPLELCLQGLGVFPERGRPRVIWVGLSGDLEAFGRLQQTVTEAVGGFGDHQEVKDFNPHLTLGRVRSDPGVKEDLSALLRRLEGPRPIRWPVRELALISSDLLSSGARYTIMNTVALG